MAVLLMDTINRWIGLSTDTKPIAATSSVPIGSTFHEYDTKLTFITYDGTNWVPYEYSLSTINVAMSRDLPYLTEFWETESIAATIWESTIDGAGTEAFGTDSGYMYYDIDTEAVGDADAFVNSKYRWQARPATFGDSNSMLKNLTLEFELQIVTAVASHDNTNFFLGFSSVKTNDIAQQNVIGFYLDSDALKGKTDNAGTESTTGAIAATLTNWNKYKITIDDTSVVFSLNDTDQTAIITNLPSIGMYLVFGTRAEAGAAVGLNIGNIRCYYGEIL